MKWSLCQSNYTSGDQIHGLEEINREYLMIWVSHEIQEEKMGQMNSRFWCWQCVVYVKQGYERSWTQTRNIRERRLNLLGWGGQETFWRLKSSTPTSCAASAEGQARRIESDSGCLCHHMRICTKTSEFADTWEHNTFYKTKQPRKQKPFES